MKELKSLKDQCKSLILYSALYGEAVSPQSILTKDLKEELKEEKAEIEKKVDEVYGKAMMGIINRGHGW